MTREGPRLVAAGVLTLIAGTAGAGSTLALAASAQTAAEKPPATAALQAAAPANDAKQPNTADVHFMSGMVPHHAQAVLIAGWAPTRALRADLKILCERIVVGQRDEIQLMRTWLGDRGLPVPDAKATHMKMTMNGMEHDMLMPGMMTDDQLKALETARGTEFDRLFLIAMIKHHEGAITMVDELFKSYGAGQDETVFRFASDVYADQTTEIDRMQKMLESLPPAKGGGQTP